MLKKYNDSIMIGKVVSNFEVLAHEIGHILLDAPGHDDFAQGVNKTHLMSDTNSSIESVFDSRRFTLDQAKIIATKRKEMLHTPPM